MITIDPRSSTPIYQQIVDKIKEDILRGILLPDQKMPSVRELARLLPTNPNTVQKAYRELERQKVIYSIRGKGSFIAAGFKNRIDQEKLQEITETLKRSIIEAHYLGVDQNKIQNIINKIYQEITPIKTEPKTNI